MDFQNLIFAVWDFSKTKLDVFIAQITTTQASYLRNIIPEIRSKLNPSSFCLKNMFFMFQVFHTMFAWGGHALW